MAGGRRACVPTWDLEQFPELIAQGSLGQLMTKQVLDRFLKEKSTAAERKQEALNWLAELEEEAVA